jgi:hypothetical protein
MPLPVHAELRHAPGLSSPDRCTGIAMSGESVAVAADAGSVPSGTTGGRAVARDRRRVAQARRASIGARDHA